MSVGKVENGVVYVGGTSFPVSSDVDAAAMVPDVLFYDNQLVSGASVCNP